MFAADYFARVTCLIGLRVHPLNKRAHKMAVTVKRRRRSGSRRSATGLGDLNTLVDSLIKENRSLKRQLARLNAKVSRAGAAGRSAGAVTRRLATITRRIERALGSPATGTRRLRSTSRATVSRRLRKRLVTAKARKPASPETQAKRLQALARAREVRAAKKAAATSASQ